MVQSRRKKAEKEHEMRDLVEMPRAENTGSYETFGLPGVQKTNWRYDNAGLPELVTITWEDGDTSTTSDPAVIAVLETLPYAPYGREVTWGYDESGQVKAVSTTKASGETVTVGNPAGIAILKGR